MPTHFVENGEHEASAKTRPRLGLPLSHHEQSRVDQARVIGAERVQVPAQRLKITGGEAQAEAIPRGLVELALLQIRPRIASGRVVGQLSLKPLGCRREDLEIRRVRIGRLRAHGHVDDLDTNALADHLDGGGPVEAEALPYEREHVTAFVAHEAVVAPTLGRHGEIRIRAAVKRTRSTIVTTSALERHELADDLHDVSSRAHALDEFVGNHVNSATVTPAPPSFHAPSRKPATRVSFFSISPTRDRSAPVPLP